MRDDAWWDDDDDDERVAALQRVLAPLREPPRAWGDVLAHARFAAVPRTSSAMRYAGVVAGLAAALLVGWIWGRASQPRIVVPEQAVVAAPYDPPRVEPGVEALPPIVVRVPVPVPSIPTPMPHDDLVKLLQNIERNKTLKALGRLGMEADKHAPTKPLPREPKKALDVDCILDPVLPQCLKGTAPNNDLPDTLTTTDIEKGMAPVKPPAKRCGAEHGATPGKSVKIKLSINGATGRVTSAVAESPHADTDLGRCVADALSNARFPRFRKASLGVVYPIRM